MSQQRVIDSIKNLFSVATCVLLAYVLSAKSKKMESLDRQITTGIQEGVDGKRDRFNICVEAWRTKCRGKERQVTNKYITFRFMRLMKPALCSARSVGKTGRYFYQLCS